MPHYTYWPGNARTGYTVYNFKQMQEVAGELRHCHVTIMDRVVRGDTYSLPHLTVEKGNSNLHAYIKRTTTGFSCVELRGQGMTVETYKSHGQTRTSRKRSGSPVLMKQDSDLAKEIIAIAEKVFADSASAANGLPVYLGLPAA